MTTQQDFIQQNSVDGSLTALQAAELLELSEGDTGLPEKSDQPEVTTEEVAAPEAELTDDKLTAENAVVLAKDGKHTISYDKLVQAREGEKHWKSQAESALQELAALKEQAQHRADAGVQPTKADANLAVAEAAIEAGADPDLFGDFSEEALAKGVQKIVDQRVSAVVAQEVAKALGPMQQKTKADAFSAHLAAIYEKHPDLDSLVESRELADWIEAQPSFARAGYKSVLTNGTTSELIEFFDTFKSSTGKSQAAPADVQAAAKAALAKAQNMAPGSLSDIPGGRAVAGSRDEAMANMDSRELSGVMENMTPAQIEEFLNRVS